MHNEKPPQAIGGITEHDVKRIEKEMNRPDPKVSEKIRKQIEFLKLFDPDFKPKHD